MHVTFNGRPKRKRYPIIPPRPEAALRDPAGPRRQGATERPRGPNLPTTSYTFRQREHGANLAALKELGTSTRGS